MTRSAKYPTPRVRRNDIVASGERESETKEATQDKRHRERVERKEKRDRPFISNVVAAAGPYPRVRELERRKRRVSREGGGRACRK